MKFALLIIFSSILLISCNDKLENTFFDEFDLGASGSSNKLIIYARFDECGEWGGHTEDIIITANSDRKFYATFRKTRVDCDKVSLLYGKPEFHEVELEKTFELTNSHKEAIEKYAKNLVHSKFSERNPGHSGKIFGIIKTDSTFIIDVYDQNSDNIKNYHHLQKELNLPITKL